MDKILTKKAKEANQALLQNDSEKALNISKRILINRKEVLKEARENNPALISVKKFNFMLKKYGFNLNEIIAGGNLNVITEMPYRLTEFDDFAIDLSDEKNYEYLSTHIDNPEFQSWLSEKITSYRQYQARNNAELEIFKTKSRPTRAEAAREAKEKFSKLTQEREEEAKIKKLEEQRKKETSLSLIKK